LNGHSIMFGLFRSAIPWILGGLVITNVGTGLAVKHYMTEAAQAVAECNADKYKSALESERAVSDALRRSLSALQQIRDRERIAAESSILALRRWSALRGDQDRPGGGAGTGSDTPSG